MMAVRMIGALLVIATCSIAPGFFFVRRLRWSPIEKLNASIALSLILVYCAAFFVFAIHAPQWCWWLITAASVALLALSFHDLVRLFRATRRTIGAFAFLFAWCLLILLLIRTYSGGAWSYDWVEHFHRTIFFLDHLPLTTKFANYHLAARPPFMNVVAAFVLAHAGARFELFSVVFAFLNTLVFFPCVLLMRFFRRPSSALRAPSPRTRGEGPPSHGPSPRLRGEGGAQRRVRGRDVFLLATLFACNPFFIENVTYTWTKLLAAFFVLLGLYFYVRGRAIPAFVSLAAGVLVHYSAGPYLVAIALHYGVRVLREKRWKEAFIGAAISLALVFTWFGWSLATYGYDATFKTNTSVTDFRAKDISTSQKIIGNVIDTLVPRALLTNTLPDDYTQESFAGHLRDYMFLLYQPNAIFAMGLIAGPLVVVLALRRVRSGFWWFFILFTLLAGIAAHGAPERTGVAHVTLQPLVLLGLTFLAANFTSIGRVLRWVVILGCLADASLGVFLQTWLQHQERDTGAFRISIIHRNGAPVDSPETTLSPFALRNWWMKESRVLIADTLRRPEIKDATRLQYDLNWELVLLHEDDQQSWNGWYSRNGELLTFAGDHTQTLTTAIFALLGAMFACVLRVLARQ